MSKECCGPDEDEHNTSNGHGPGDEHDHDDHGSAHPDDGTEAPQRLWQVRELQLVCRAFETLNK